MNVYIMCGVSGSGKSTAAESFRTDRILGSAVVSADDYFINPITGNYDFDPALISKAHAECLNAFIACLNSIANFDVLVVDNTNTTLLEIAPYYTTARALRPDCKVHLVVVECDPEIANARNSHGVPLATTVRQASNIRQLVIPPYWDIKVIDPNGNELVKYYDSI